MTNHRLRCNSSITLILHAIFVRRVALNAREEESTVKRAETAVQLRPVRRALGRLRADSQFRELKATQA